MTTSQKGILEPSTAHARFMVFGIHSAEHVADTLKKLNANLETDSTLIGLGSSVVSVMQSTVPGLKNFPAFSESGIDIPATPAAIWCWCRGDDRGELFHQSRKIEDILSSAFELETVVDSFQFKKNRDMSGYEDGTENPQNKEAIAAAIVNGMGEGLDGSSFVAVQQWVHDFDALNDMSVAEQDDSIGRHISDNKEFDEAPESAHVKRTAQENFEPEAFIVRRSMPWSDEMSAGLNFIAFGKSFDAFEAQLKRMIGLDDGIVDALFKFSKPISGNYFWCPPVKDNRLDMSLLGI